MLNGKSWEWKNKCFVIIKVWNVCLMKIVENNNKQPIAFSNILIPCVITCNVYSSIIAHGVFYYAVTFELFMDIQLLLLLLLIPLLLYQKNILNAHTIQAHIQTYLLYIYDMAKKCKVLPSFRSCTHKHRECGLCSQRPFAEMWNERKHKNSRRRLKEGELWKV
jgi:hypothetical protein